jgi:putative sterol carrier protein
VQADIATDEWLKAFKDEINDSSSFEEQGRRWDASLGLAFLPDEHDARSRYVVLELHDGRCGRAEFVPEGEYEKSSYRLSGPWDRWRQLTEGRLEPLKAIVLKRIDFGGDLLRMATFLPAAKALLECACRVTSRADEHAS